jgi:hypothetical protein
VSIRQIPGLKGDSAAFPFTFMDNNTNTQHVFTGLSVRQHFAAMAMQGLLAGNPITTSPDWERAVAKLAVTHADALIAELAKEPK